MLRLATLTVAAAFALAVGFAGPAQAVDLTDGLVGFWHFNTNSGTDDAVDGSVNDNVGVFNNAADRSTDIPDVFGNVNSITLGGNNDFIGIADDDALDLGTGDLSIDAWIKTSANTGIKVILDKRPLASNIGYHMFLSNGDLGFQLADGTFTNFISGTDVADGDWHHVAVTVDRDDAASGLKLYVDGTVVDTFNPTGRAGSLDNDADLFIGKRRNSTVSASFNGLIDEVRIYDRALPVEEIEILASGKALPDPYADAVASFTLPPSPPNDDCLVAGGDCDTTTDDNDQGADAVDAPDHTQHGGGSAGVSTFTSLGFDNDTGVGGILKLNFTDNTCLDLGGDDIQIFEVSHGETYDVDIGLAGGSLANIGTDKSGDASLESSVAVFNQVALEATSGGAAGLDGPDIDAAECLNVLDFGPDHIQKENTGAETINIGVDVVQSSFQFQITIANNTGSDTGLDDILVFDVVPGEFDLVGDVAPTDNNGCTVTLTHPAGAVKKGLIKLEPEFITIDPSGLANGEMCMITVNVETDTKNFPRGKSPVFAPTECNEETFIFLNEGVQVFRDDGDTGGVVDKNDTLLFEDDDPPIELTCVFPS